MKHSKRMLFRVLLNLGIITVLFASLIGPVAAVTADSGSTVWSFGVMGDTQWSCPTDPSGLNPGGCAVSVIDQLNDEFIEKGVKFVLQTGDLTNGWIGTNYSATPDMSRRAAAAQELYDAGIGFFPMRGNHDMYEANHSIPAFRSNFPQTQGLSNTFGATDFSSPDIAELSGVSYAFKYNNASFVILDDWATDNKQVTVVSGYPYGYSVGEQQDWISNSLDKSTRGTDQAFVFAHHNLMGENHYDCLFTGYANSNLDMQNTFFNSLQSNDVKYFFSGHEHLYNRSLITSPDGLSVVEDIICSHDDPKFIVPKDPNMPNFFGQKTRQQQISQELNNLGYYICTIDGTKVTVDYYSDETGGYLGDVNWPKGPGAGNQITPTFNFILKETWGYDLNGKQFIVPQGQQYTSVSDSYGGTDLQILSGANGCTDKDYFNRQFTKTVNTGWTDKNNDALRSNIATLWGMPDFVKSETDTYTIALTYEEENTPYLSSGSVGIASLNGEGKWVNTVDLNYGGTKNFVLGPWDPAYGLGTYGIDTDTNTAWAVINHASDFAVSSSIEPVTGPQTWQLDSEPTPAGYQMERTKGPGDDGQSGEVAILPGETITWIADEVAASPVTFSSGTWKIEIATEEDWGLERSNCGVTFGEWNSGGYTAFATAELVKTGWSEGSIAYIFKLDKQSGSATVPAGSYLAVQITNNDGDDHTVYTAESEKTSGITSPLTDPGYPVPETAAIVLVGAGLAGLAVFAGIKRKQNKAKLLS
jgi:hypothetical protein